MGLDEVRSALLDDRVVEGMTLTALSLALAVVADLLLVLAQRLATPWARAGKRRRQKAAA